MHPPSPTFELDYRHDRRRHKHRCRCCDKLLETGQRALMVRLRGYRGNKTWALHVACANKPFGAPAADAQYGVGLGAPSCFGWTWRDAFEAWGTEHLRRCGWKLDEHPMARGGAVKSEAA